ncbi:hypothetical protein B0T19DRAFT_428155 [Cercophora scortea]|uniref:Uncharacterized protein n=1 Tax=Cercophora scortea TaxID=314031 RepID=A0AAE0IFL6_9PEZI|nr:hypothetical protein B0T19DRAFT_428155 [Cercophora scortea]
MRIHKHFAVCGFCPCVWLRAPCHTCTYVSYTVHDDWIDACVISMHVMYEHVSHEMFVQSEKGVAIFRFAHHHIISSHHVMSPIRITQEGETKKIIIGCSSGIILS